MTNLKHCVHCAGSRVLKKSIWINILSKKLPSRWAVIDCFAVLFFCLLQFWTLMEIVNPKRLKGKFLTSIQKRNPYKMWFRLQRCLEKSQNLASIMKTEKEMCDDLKILMECFDDDHGCEMEFYVSKMAFKGVLSITLTVNCVLFH